PFGLLRAHGVAVLVGIALSAPAAAQAPESGPARLSSANAATISVSGRVVDTFGKPVADAHVGVRGAAGATTGREGGFGVAAPIGATLQVERDGYDVALARVTDGALADVVVLPLGESAETIEVHGEAPPASPGAAKLDRGELQRIPGSGGDVVRALT